MLIIISFLRQQHINTSFNVQECWNKILTYNKFISPEIYLLKEKFDNHEYMGWEDICRIFKNTPINIYDILTIASYMIQQDVDNEFQLIDGDALRGWKDRDFDCF